MAKIDTWRYMRAARAIQTDTPAQKLILMLLASHIGADGTCWPSYPRLMQQSGYASRSTITNALQYLRDTLKIVSWRKGWGNAHKKGVPNVYKFDYPAMSRLVDESTPDVDESTPDEVMKVHPTGDERPPGQSLSTSREVPVKEKNQPMKGPASPLPSLSSSEPLSESRREGKHPSLEQSTPSVLSSTPTPITLAGLLAKKKHASEHGGLALDELNHLRAQIAFMEGN